MIREDVFKEVDRERKYQTVLWEGKEHSIEEFMLYMEDYLNEAKHIQCRLADATSKPLTLAGLRKVVALGVACLEIHGCPSRDMNDLSKACELHAVNCEKE